MKKFLAMAVLGSLATLFVACDDKKADTKTQAPAAQQATQEASKPADTAASPATTEPSQDADKATGATATDANSTTQAPATQDSSKPAGTDKPSK